MSRLAKVVALGRRVGLDGQPRETCPACQGTGMAPSEADAVRGLVDYFAKAAEEAGFLEAPPQPAPLVDDEAPSPCSLCYGELLVTAAACAEHQAEVAQSTAVTMQRLEATADALRRCDARWQRPPEAMSPVEQLMSWWNRAVDATTGSPEGPSPSGTTTSKGPELVPPAESPLGRVEARRGIGPCPARTTTTTGERSRSVTVSLRRSRTSDSP